MRRSFFILIFLFTSIFVFADEILFSDRPGSYAIYNDLRFEGQTLIGICYAGENTVLARSYEVESGNELQLLIQFVIKDNEISLGDNLRILKGDMNSSQASARLLPMLMNWANTWYNSKEEINKKNIYSVSTDDDYFYNSWLPVFQLDYIGNKKDISVFSIGLIADFSDERFFRVTNVPQPVESESYKIKKGKALDVVIDGLSVPLDDNWKTENNRLYRIHNKTPQDAAFMIETINYIEAGIPSLKELTKILLIVNMNIVLLTDGLSIEAEDNIYNITMKVFDPVQNKVTIQQKQLIDREDGYVSIATLACYETLYLQNKKYFDKILH